MLKHKQILKLSLCVSVLIIAAAYILLSTAGDGILSMAEPDHAIYMQYARNMAQGHPLVFSPGDAPSTGSTTYLYIFLLSLLFKLGLAGNAVMTGSFILNAMFYLGIVTAVWLIAKKIAPRTLPLTMALTVMSGHTVSAVLKQTDIGFFTLLALFLFTALIYHRHKWTLLLLILCALTRPEGFVFSVAIFVCGLGGLILNKWKRSPTPLPGVRYILYGICGVLAFFMTLAINHAMTGQLQFMSVASKGYFKAYPLGGAIMHTLYDSLSLIKGVFMGLEASNRQFYLFPVLSGFLGIGGVMLHSRKDQALRVAESWLALVAGATLLLVATSQWAGISNDRYLGWLIVIWIIYIALGIYEIHDRVKTRYFLPICFGLLLMYQCVSLLYIASSSYSNACLLELRKAFAHVIAEHYEPHVVFAGTNGNSLNYFIPNHTIKNIRGMTTPEFSLKREYEQLHPVIELLKHNKESRFDYWISTESFVKNNPEMAPLLGNRLLQDTDTALLNNEAYGIYATKWELLDGGEYPSLIQIPDEMQLVDKLDIGYLEHESGHKYQVIPRIRNMRLTTMSTSAKLREKDYLEAGRIILGSERFTISNVTRGKDLTCVLRTGIRGKGDVYYGMSKIKLNNFELNSQLLLRLFVDGKEVHLPKLDLSSEGFSEVAFTIPGMYIENRSPVITLIGDHISYAYWFFQ